jgi:hypothetical protein
VTRDDALNALRANTTHLRDLEQQLTDTKQQRLHLIAAARAAQPRPASWSEIGEAIDQDKSNAYTTYNDKVNAILAAEEGTAVTALTITNTRADLLHAIDAGKVTEDWYNDQSGTIRRDAFGGQQGTVVTGKVRVMKAAGLCETDPTDAGSHVRGIRLTDVGRKALAEHDATTGQQP